MTTTMDPISSPLFVIFPFMSKGHTIPLLHLARLLRRHGVSVTVFTTHANLLYIRSSLSDTDISVTELPFPQSIPGIPPGVESTDQLPSLSLFLPFTLATKLLQPHFEAALETLPQVSCIISDGFLGWTLESAKKLNIPRLVSYGMCCYPMTIRRAILGEYPDIYSILNDKSVPLKSLPWINIARDDLGPQKFGSLGPSIWSDFVIEQAQATSNSHGVLFNSYNELEPAYIDHWNKEFKPRGWCVGPLCLASPPRIEEEPIWVRWLDARAAQGRAVLYVAFGTQVDVSPEQLKEIADGLKRSEVDFLWVMKLQGLDIEESVKERGFVVREWVDQPAILQHEAVKGFVSHCGWNSISESMCAAVPILAWPMMGDQFLNAKMVEELGIGLRMGAPCNEPDSVVVKSETIANMVRELMVGEKGKEAAKKIKGVAGSATKAMQEGGSSWRALELLIHEVCNVR